MTRVLRFTATSCPALLGLLARFCAQAQTWNLAEDWHEVNQPASPWAVGSLDVHSSAGFMPFAAQINPADDWHGFTGLSGWATTMEGGPLANVPMVAKNMGGGNVPGGPFSDWPEGDVACQTFYTNHGYGRSVVVKWTAPADLIISIRGALWHAAHFDDEQPMRRMRVTVWVNCRPLCKEVLVPLWPVVAEGDATADSTKPFTLAEAMAAGGGQAESLQRIRVREGGAVLLGITQDTSHGVYGSVVGLRLEITGTPWEAQSAQGAVTMEQRQHDQKASFFVATDGNDRWSGTLPEPNADGTDGPLATLRPARDAVREMKTVEGLKKPVTVMVRGGKHYLPDTLALGPQDSGTREYPITYTAYRGEKPVISGGRKLTGWRPYEGNILQRDVPEARGGIWQFRQLFVNGERQIRARCPNFDPENPLYGRGWKFVEAPAEEGSFVAFRYRPDAFPRHWAKPTQAEVFMMHPWGVTDLIPIKTMDGENRVITLAQGVRDFAVVPWFISTPISAGHRFYIENVLEELDQPGEWCLDTEDGTLYLWPPTDAIEEAEVVAPSLGCLIDLRGASWITISGFTFTETVNGGQNMHRTGHEGYGAMAPVDGRTYCGEALHMRGTEHCCIEDNRFYAVGGNAIYLEDYNARNVIRHNEIAAAGHNAIVLIGSKYFHSVPHHPIYNEVVDNHIHHCGVFDKYAAGVFLGVSDGNLIAHNRIEHVPHHAINLGNSGYGRNLVEYNEIRHACLETHDNGAINSWMEDPYDHVYRDAERSGHVIRYNLIADTRGCTRDEAGHLVPGGFQWGIYLDNFTSNCFVYGNIIVRSAGMGGVYINGGKNNIIENNIFVDCKVAVGSGNISPLYASHMGDFRSGNRVCTNIVYHTQAPDPWSVFLYGSWSDRVVARSDCNLFFSRRNTEPTVDTDGQHHRLSEWQGMGYDEHSVIADPMFLDPEHDDYRLGPESPALKLGFQPIDTSRIGPRERT